MPETSTQGMPGTMRCSTESFTTASPIKGKADILTGKPSGTII